MKIIFEDEFFLVISKPSGMVVNISASSTENTLQQWVEAHFRMEGPAGSDFKNRAGIVHRLDKDTSGIITIAKKEEIFSSLQEQFGGRTAEKTYLSLVHGSTPSGGTVIAPVGRLPWDRMKFGVIPDGRYAETRYQKEADYGSGKEAYSYLSIFPKTGRTHQIRIHMKHLGFAVVSDPLYAGRKVYRHDSELCSRMFLHSHKLTINHPVTGAKMEFKDPLPSELEEVLAKLTMKS